MFVSDLITPWKPRKKKKGRQQFMYMGIPYAVVQSGTGEDTIGAGAGIDGGIGESVDDMVDEWEAEESDDGYERSFKIKPSLPTGWSNFGHVAVVLDDAFGSGKWSISSAIVPRANNPITVYLKKSADKNFKLLKANGIQILFMEAAGDTIPVGIAKLPDKIMIGNGYYLEKRHVKPVHATYDLKRLLDDDSGAYLVISKRKMIDRGTNYIVQLHGDEFAKLDYSIRTHIGSVGEFDPFEVKFIKNHVRNALDAAGLLRD